MAWGPGCVLRRCDDCKRKAWTKPDETEALWFVCEECDALSKATIDGEMANAETTVIAAFALLFVAQAHKRRSRGQGNPPLGLWVSEFAGTPLGGYAFKGATIAKEMLDAEGR